jgi:hypothetical protein
VNLLRVAKGHAHGDDFVSWCEEFMVGVAVN